MTTKVLDTNIILEHSLRNIVDKFDKKEEETEIVITFNVIMELDTFKKGNDTKNYNARESLRLLEELRRKARSEGKSIADGIGVTDRCSIKIFVSEEDLKIDPRKVDNDIILSSKVLEQEGGDVEILTLDLHERIIADCFDIDSTSFTNEIEIEELYSGKTHIGITDKQLQEANECHYSSRMFKTTRKLNPNEFVVMEDSMNNLHYGRYDSSIQSIRLLKENYEAWGIKPKKDKYGKVAMEQAMLMDMLLNPDIEFVTAIGPSGTGKTLITLACALEQTINDRRYSKVIVMRPLASLDKDLGALPGDKLEKLEPWMGSSFDNLEFLLDKKCPKHYEDISHPRERVYEMIESGVIELEAMQFIRGRSIPNQFIIVDDAQNLSPHQAATIITRAGENSKVVFLGDISKQQIDNPRLNSCNNGLTYVVDRFKGKDQVIGHITFNKVVRSKLASLGVELL